MTTGYAKIGLSGDYGIAWLLTRLVGTSRARELMFLSARIDAKRCEQLALLNQVVAGSELREAAISVASTLAQGPSIAFASMKDNLDQAVTSDLLSSLDQEADRMVRAARTSDHKDAVATFATSESPSFTDDSCIPRRWARRSPNKRSPNKKVRAARDTGPCFGTTEQRRRRSGAKGRRVRRRSARRERRPSWRYPRRCIRAQPILHGNADRRAAPVRRLRMG